MGQVGQTSLAVVPTMRGFRKKINAESKAAAQAGGKSITSEFGKTGVQAGRAMGQNFKRGSVDAGRALQDLTRKNAAATSAWSNANRTHADQLGRVRVAQAKLNDATTKYGSDSTQAISAQERLSSAQRKSEETAVRLQVAQDRLTAATNAMKAAQDGAAKSGGVWRQLGSDLAPVTQRLTAMRDRMVDVFSKTKLGKGLSSMFDKAGSSIARATLSTYNFGEKALGAVARSASSAGKSLSGAFNGALIKSPQLNAAFTMVGDRLKSIGTGAVQVFGGLGRAAVTAGGAIGGALGPGLSSVWSGLTSQVSGAATAFTSMLGGAAIATGAIIAGAMTKAMVGGFSRLSGIENAEAKMRGLGFASSDVKKVMADASDAVDGTAFSLDEMASSASVAMAAGIKPGAELNKYMKTLKNASAAANVPLGEMGQILNKTITSGRAYTLEINQIADRGLPIWSKLAEAYGVTADEMRKMVSEGEVDSATFLQVVENMSGAVADEMGGTTSSAIRNFGTALSKLGADMLQGLYPVIGPLFNAMKSGVQMLQQLGAPAFEAMGEAMAPLADRLTRFNDLWAEAKDKISEGASPMLAIVQVFRDMGMAVDGPLAAFRGIKEAFDSLGAALGPIIGGLLGALGPLLARLPMIGGAFTGLTGPVGIFIGLLVAVWQQSEAFRDAVGAVFEGLLDALGPVFEAMGPVLKILGDAFATVAGVLGDVLAEALMVIVPLFAPLGETIAVLVEALGPILELVGPIAEMLGGILVAAVQAVTPLVTYLSAVLVELQPIIMMLSGVIVQLLMALMPLLEPLGALIANFLPPLITLFTAVLTPVMQLVTTIISALLPVIQALLKILEGLITFVVGVFTGDWEKAWSGIKLIFTGFKDAIWGIVKGIGDIFTGLVDTIFSVFGGVGTWLVDSGKSLIQGFIDGMMAGFEWAGEKLSGAVEWVKGFFPHSPAKRGPLSGAGWRKLRESGAAFAGQWIGGADDEFHSFDLPDLVTNGAPSLTAAVVGARGAGAGEAGREVRNVEVTNNIRMFDRDPRIVGKQIGRSLEGELV